MKATILKTTLVALMLASLGTLMAQTQQVRVFAHRGGRYEQDENTLSAFQATYAKGVHGFETDVRMTKDGQLVISHDASLERMTGNKGIIEQMDAKELRKVVSKKGNPLLFLDDLLAFLKDKTGLYVEFEMKTTNEEAYPEEKLDEYLDKLYGAAMAAKPADADFLFTSFDTRVLRKLKAKHPEAEIMYLSGSPCSDKTITAAKAVGAKRMGVGINGTSREAVAEAHKQGLIVSLWPGNKVEDTVLGVYLGADYLCTDIPQEVKTFMAEKMPWLNIKY